MRRVREGMYVCCRAGGMLIGIDLDRVQEINRLVEPTAVPLLPEHVRGVVNLRGNLVTVLDLDGIVRGQHTTVGKGTRTVVLEAGGETCGLLVDEVGDVVDIANLTREPLSGLLPPDQRKWFSGFVQLPEGLLLLLEVDTVANCGVEGVEVRGA